MTEETQAPKAAAAPAAADAKGSSEPKKEVSKEAPTPHASEAASVEVPAKFRKIVEEIESMSVIDLNELVKVFEEKFGVSATAVAVVGPASGPAEEVSSEVTIKLTSGGEQKIAVIKAIREALSVGLADAKKLVDGAPSVLKEHMKREEAEVLKKKIEEAGGKVEFA